jgi:hypothetical protein
VIRLYEYTGSAEQDLDTACLEVTQQDPLGVYAVDYMKYDIARVMSYFEVNLDIVYKRTWEQISEVISVTGSSAILGELREVLADFQKEKVLRVSYFDPNMEESHIISMVEEAYYDVPEGAFGMPSVSVQLYPEQAVGQQRLVEILLEYSEPIEELKKKQAALLAQSEALTKPLLSLSESVKLQRIVQILKQNTPMLSSGEETATAYTALIEGQANEEGLALATELLVQQSGLQCRIVRGSRYGKDHFWNIVQIDDEWKHLDLTVENPQPHGDEAMQQTGYHWSGDIPVCSEINIQE